MFKISPLKTLPSGLKRVLKVRMADWFIATAVLLLAVAVLAPQQVPVVLFKVALVTMGGVAGYWLDRRLFPYARPDALLEDHEGAEGSAPGAAVPEVALTFTEPVAGEPGDAELLRFMSACMQRRALIVAACVLAVCMGA